MALTVNTNIINDLDNYSLDAKQVKGTYVAVNTIIERDALPPATIITGSLCYVSEVNKYYIYNGTSWQEASFAGGDVTDVTVNGTSVVENKIAKVVIPTNVSAFTNDAGYITPSYHDASKQDKLTAGNKITLTLDSEGNTVIDTDTSKVSVTSAGTSINDIRYIKVDGQEYRIASATQGVLDVKVDDASVVDSEGVAQIDLTGKQNVIDATHKLNANLVDDSSSVNKFVTASEKETWSGKQDALSAQTAYSSKGSSTKVPQISTNSLGQVTNISEVIIDKTTLADLGITATATELNVLDGITATTQELNYTDGVTSNIQTQLNNKQATVSDLETIRSNATAGAGAATTIATYGNIVTHNTNEFATAAQGIKADTALQSGSNISLLNNDSGYTTNTGTVTSVGVKMNGSTKGTVTTSGVIDLGTVLTEHQTLSDLGITATAQELNYTDGVTSSIQTQLNSKLTTNDIVDTAASTATDKALSANRGRDLQDQINNLKARGRFLSTWNCVTGLPETDPTELTSEGIYEYKSGDYYIVGTIASGSGTNYKPNGTSYTPRVASTTIETESVAVGGSYYFDGVNWVISSGTTQTVTFSAITGQPADNLNLATALNAKVTANNAITGATKTKITYDSKGLVTAGADLTASDIPSLTLSKISDVTATAAEVNYLSGVTSNVQTQLNNKLTKNADITGATKTKITYDSKGLVTSGGDLAASDIPALDASKITTGQFADARIASAATWNAKQNAITASNKLSASLVDGLATVATSGAYGDLTGTPTKTSNFINDGSDGTHPFLTDHQSLAAYRTSANQDLIDQQLQSNIDAKQDALTTQTAYTNKGTATKVAQITTNSLGQVTNINEVDIAKTTLSDLGVTATAAELNILDGATLSTTELNYVDGVTSSIQTQLNNKQATISDLADIRSGATLGSTAVQPAAIADMATKTWVGSEGFVKTLGDLDITATATELNTLDGITSSTAELNKLTGVTTTSTELNYVSGVTSSIQTQLNNKEGVISDLSGIRAGAAKGETAIQPLDNVSELTNDAGYITSASISGKEDTSNKTQSITSASTTDQYPSAKAVYEYHDATKENTISDLADIRSGAALGTTALQPNEAITAATKTKITYDTNGLVTAGADLAASDIPNLDATKITSGQFSDAYIASASTWNNKQDALVSGTNIKTINNNTILGSGNLTIEGANPYIIDGGTTKLSDLTAVAVGWNGTPSFSPVEWDGDTTGKHNINFNLGQTFNLYKVSDTYIEDMWSLNGKKISTSWSQTYTMENYHEQENGTAYGDIDTFAFILGYSISGHEGNETAIFELSDSDIEYCFLLSFPGARTLTFTKEGASTVTVTIPSAGTYFLEDYGDYVSKFFDPGQLHYVPTEYINVLNDYGLKKLNNGLAVDFNIAQEKLIGEPDTGAGTQNIKTVNGQNILGEGNISIDVGVTGVKGDKETNYRTGQVNLTPANIGAQPALPTVTNDRYLHTNSSTGALEWSSVDAGVTGVKGNSESSYRTGQVNLTAANVGAEPADATILKKANVVDDVTTTTTNVPLSANQGKLLNDRINNLESIGRFLSVWNCTTGLPTSDPTSLPYNYKSGDYYRVGVIGTTNYRPTGSSYNHVPSTVEETETVDVGYIYYYDGNVWTLQAGSPEGKVQDVQVNGTTILVGGIANLTATNAPSIPLSKVSDVTATATEVNVLDGITSTTAELNILHGVTADKDELNILDGATVTTAELNYVHGVTSNIQTQLSGKQENLPTYENNKYLHVKSDGTGLEWSEANGAVTGVKGNAEASYRTGNVNITASNLGLAQVATTGAKADVGLGNVVNTGDSATPVSGGTTKFTTGGAYTELAKKQDTLTAGTGISIVGNVISVSSIVNGVVSNITGDGTTTQFTINHGLNTRDVSVQIYDLTTYDTVIADVTRSTLSSILIDFKDAPVSGKQYRVMIMSFSSPVIVESVNEEVF